MLKLIKDAIVFIVVIGFVSVGLFALPDSIQADKYLIAAKKHIDAGEYDQAVEYFEKILELDVDIADDFYYHYGSTLYKNRSYKKAIENLTQYIELTGRGSKYYQQALEMLIEAEENFYELGDTGPAGGIVFYDKGRKSNGWRFIEITPEPLGRYNFENAVKKCQDLEMNGYNDWYLPNEEDWEKLTNKKLKNIYIWESLDRYWGIDGVEDSPLVISLGNLGGALLYYARKVDYSDADELKFVVAIRKF